MLRQSKLHQQVFLSGRLRCLPWVWAVSPDVSGGLRAAASEDGVDNLPARCGVTVLTEVDDATVFSHRMC